ncbi:glycosyltransferase [Hathewaya histolytica]
MLPPGINKIVENSTNTHEELNIFYVGAITGLYNLEKLFKVVNDIEGIKLTVCCREKEWADNRYIYEKYLHKNINIVHGSGDDIERYYLQADVLSLFFQPSEYRKFAMPIKLFEYIGYGKPMIATKGTATGEFVEKYDIGWNIEYSEEALFDLLLDVLRNKKLKEKSQNIKNIIPLNTWEERCKVIIEDLS